MKRSPFPFRLSRSLLASWHRHKTLSMLLLVLSVVAASSSFLAADLGGGSDDSGGSESSAPDEELRVCSSFRTPFQGMTSLAEVMKLFRKRMSAAVAERERFLSSTSSWQCLPSRDGANEPVMSVLSALAADLPSWSYKNPDGSTSLRPVTFDAFASILGEFEFAYECKLSEFQEDAFRTVYADQDLPDPTEIEPDQSHFATRAPSYESLQTIERQRARDALEKTIHTLRSFELSYAYAKQLTCFQRASLDLKNELGLLADTISCMPKIWDALTSLHDRSSSASSEE